MQLLVPDITLRIPRRSGLLAWAVTIAVLVAHEVVAQRVDLLDETRRRGVDVQDSSRCEVRFTVSIPSGAQITVQLRKMRADDLDFKNPDPSFEETYLHDKNYEWLTQTYSKDDTYRMRIPKVPELPTGPYALFTRYGSGSYQCASEAFRIRASRGPVAVVRSSSMAMNAPFPGRYDIAALKKRMKMSVVHIQGENGQGTGFVVNPFGHIVTAAHVVDCSGKISVTYHSGAIGGNNKSCTFDYQCLGDPFPLSHEADRQLTVLTPKAGEESPFDGVLSYFLPLASADGDRRRVDFIPAGEEDEDVLYIGAWPSGDEESYRMHKVRRITNHGEKVRLTDGYSSKEELDYLRYECDRCDPGDSGAPVVDEAGTVWGVNVTRGTEGGVMGHWAFDIVTYYRALNSKGNLPTKGSSGS